MCVWGGGLSEDDYVLMMAAVEHDQAELKSPLPTFLARERTKNGAAINSKMYHVTNRSGS